MKPTLLKREEVIRWFEGEEAYRAFHQNNPDEQAMGALMIEND